MVLWAPCLLHIEIYIQQRAQDVQIINYSFGFEFMVLKYIMILQDQHQVTKQYTWNNGSHEATNDKNESKQYFYNTPANSVFFRSFTKYIITFIGLYLAFHDVIPDYSSSVTYIWLAKLFFDQRSMKMKWQACIMSMDWWIIHKHWHENV